jgi:molecular chaperone GrpE (heat shock protein)
MSEMAFRSKEEQERHQLYTEIAALRAKVEELGAELAEAKAEIKNLNRLNQNQAETIRGLTSWA